MFESNGRNWNNNAVNAICHLQNSAARDFCACYILSKCVLLRQSEIS